MRLYVTLAESRRSNGGVRPRHLASLGVFGLNPAARSWVAVGERGAIWRELNETIGLLRIDTEAAALLMAALQKVVPYPTPEEVGAAELAEAEHDAQFWDGIHGSTHELIGAHHKLIETTQQKIGELEEQAEQEKQNAESAKAKAARLANYRGY
jgi:hypothetical protein